MPLCKSSNSTPYSRLLPPPTVFLFSCHRQGPRDQPLRRRDSVPLRDFTGSGGSDGSGGVINGIGGGGGGNAAVGIGNGNAVGTNALGNAVGNGYKNERVEQMPWWPPSDVGSCAGRGGGRGMPPDVARTDVLPAKLRYRYHLIRDILRQFVGALLS